MEPLAHHRHVLPRRRAAGTLRRRNEERCRPLVGPPRPLSADHLDERSVAEVPLDEPTLTCLVYMRDVEGFTDRDLTGFAGHPTTLADPLIGPFLEMWRVEERAHAAVIERFLDLYARGMGADIPDRQVPPPSHPPLTERLMVQLTRPVGHVVAAAHMVWGAANELLTFNGYRLLARRSQHPVLTDLLGRIAAQESRHFSFYALQAEWRLADSALARRAIRRVLEKAWTPVGIGDGYKDPSEFAEVLGYLATGNAGARAIARMDQRFDRLPGLSGLDIYARAGILAPT